MDPPPILPQLAATGATDGATVPLCVFIFGCALLLSLRDRSVVTRTRCTHSGIGPVLAGGRAMHDLRGSVVLQPGSIKQARMLDVLAVLMHRNAEVRPARKGKRFCLESGSEKEAAARRMFRRCSPRKGMYYGTSSGRLAGCHAGPTRPPESAAEASTTYAAGEHLPRAQQFANPCGGHSRQRRTNFPTIWGCKPS